MAAVISEVTTQNSVVLVLRATKVTREPLGDYRVPGKLQRTKESFLVVGPTLQLSGVARCRLRSVSFQVQISRNELDSRL